MYYQPQPGKGPPSNQPGQQQQTRNMAPGSHPQMSSPNVAPSPAQSQQMSVGGGYPHPGSVGPIPFSPQQHGGMYGGGQQQMMAGPHSQQQMANPMSVGGSGDHMIGPNTPQQQQQLQQPHSIGQMQQPGSVQMQQPGSIGPPIQQQAMATPASSMGQYGPGTAAPTSVGSANSSSAGRQLPTQQSTPASGQPVSTLEFDPVASAKMLMLKELRRAIVELNQCAEKTVERIAAETSTASTAAPDKHEEKKVATVGLGSGGPHSNLGAGGPHSIGPGGPHSIGPCGPHSIGPGGPHSIGPGGPHSIGPPHSNLGFGGGGPHSVLNNPHSVQNPLSIPNPQSVNPQSVSGAGGGIQQPGSVRSVDDGMAAEKSTTKKQAASAAMDLSPREQYEQARNQFMNVCDQIERNILLIQEVNRQQGKLYNQQAGSAVAWLPTPAEINAPTSTLPQVLHGFSDLMNADKQAIKANIQSLSALMSKISGKKK